MSGADFFGKGFGELIVAADDALGAGNGVVGAAGVVGEGVVGGDEAHVFAEVGAVDEVDDF